MRSFWYQPLPNQSPHHGPNGQLRPRNAHHGVVEVVIVVFDHPSGLNGYHTPHARLIDCTQYPQLTSARRYCDADESSRSLQTISLERWFPHVLCLSTATSRQWPAQRARLLPPPPPNPDTTLLGLFCPLSSRPGYTAVRLPCGLDGLKSSGPENTLFC